MRRPRVLVLKVAAPQVGRRVVQPVERQVERQVVQPVELQVVQPVEAQQVVPLAVQREPEQQEPRVLLEQRVPQVRLRVRSPGLLAL